MNLKQWKKIKFSNNTRWCWYIRSKKKTVEKSIILKTNVWSYELKNLPQNKSLSILFNPRISLQGLHSITTRKKYNLMLGYLSFWNLTDLVKETEICGFNSNEQDESRMYRRAQHMCVDIIPIIIIYIIPIIYYTYNNHKNVMPFAAYLYNLVQHTSLLSKRTQTHAYMHITELVKSPHLMAQIEQFLQHKISILRASF